MPAPTTISTTTVDVATAIAAEINSPVAGTTWSQTVFACARKWLPKYTDAELVASIRIAVMPISEKTTRIARKIVQRDHLVELWLQKMVDPAPAAQDAAVDGLATFAFQIKDYFLESHRVLSTLANVYIMGSEVNVSYSPSELAERSLWVGVIKLMLQERTNQ